MTQNGLPEFELERYLPYRFTVLASQLSAELAKHYKSQYGISMPEWRVLLNVGYAEHPSVRDIEQRVSLEKTKVSRAAAKLEEKGFITKKVDPQDRRLLMLDLTEEGAKLLGKLIPVAQKYQTELETILGETESTLQAALDIISEKMNDKAA